MKNVITEILANPTFLDLPHIIINIPDWNLFLFGYFFEC